MTPSPEARAFDPTRPFTTVCGLTVTNFRPETYSGQVGDLGRCTWRADTGINRELGAFPDYDLVNIDPPAASGENDVALPLHNLLRRLIVDLTCTAEFRAGPHPKTMERVVKEFEDALRPYLRGELVVTDEAVEAAAEAMLDEYRKLRSDRYLNWQELGDFGRSSWKKEARAAITAALPHLRTNASVEAPSQAADGDQSPEPIDKSATHLTIINDLLQTCDISHAEKENPEFVAAWDRAVTYLRAEGVLDPGPKYASSNLAPWFTDADVQRAIVAAEHVLRGDAGCKVEAMRAALSAISPPSEWNAAIEAAAREVEAERTWHSASFTPAAVEERLSAAVRSLKRGGTTS